jgi:hypothetical protein
MSKVDPTAAFHGHSGATGASQFRKPESLAPPRIVKALGKLGRRLDLAIQHPPRHVMIEYVVPRPEAHRSIRCQLFVFPLRLMRRCIDTRLPDLKASPRDRRHRRVTSRA